MNGTLTRRAPRRKNWDLQQLAWLACVNGARESRLKERITGGEIDTLSWPEAGAKHGGLKVVERHTRYSRRLPGSRV